jgi:hypothetical protein
MYFVPVVNLDTEPLMPTTIRKARRWIVVGKATPFWKKGIFCIRLNYKKEVKLQPIAIGIDPGSKKEGFTVKSAAHTFLNIQTDAVSWVKCAIETRSDARKARRFRNTPCRQPRWNRKGRILAPSTKARWQWKIRILNWLKKLFPITNVIVEDIKARTTGKRNWDKSFSPLQTGKTWFYEQIDNLTTKEGWETKQLRDDLNLTKTSNKLSNDFSAHCVDSWVLANDVVGGHSKPDNKKVMCITPLQFHRRQLHVFLPTKGGIRKSYGGTRSLGFKRGSLVRHKKYGLVYVGGTSNNRISLHSVETKKRISQNIKSGDCKLVCYSSWVLS